MRSSFRCRLVAAMTILLLALSGLCACHKQPEQPAAAQDYVFYFTSSTASREDAWWGNVEAMRRAESAPGNVLGYHLGNALRGSALALASKGGASLNVMHALGVSGVLPGEDDYLWGASRLSALATAEKMPFLVANLTDGAGVPLFAGYQIIDKGDKRIGVFGIADPDIRGQLPEGIGISDPVDALNKVRATFSQNGVHIAVMLLDSRSDAFRSSMLGYAAAQLVVDLGYSGADVEGENGYLLVAPGRGDQVLRVVAHYNDARTAYRFEASRLTPQPANEQSAPGTYAARTLLGATYAAALSQPLLRGQTAPIASDSAAESMLGRMACWGLQRAVQDNDDRAFAFLPARLLTTGSVEAGGLNLRALGAFLPLGSRVCYGWVDGSVLLAWATESAFSSANFSGISFARSTRTLYHNGLPVTAGTRYKVAWGQGAEPPFAVQQPTVCALDLSDALLAYLQEMGQWWAVEDFIAAPTVVED